jgi:NADP-dependent 3-hydroxy acid dehydrogenase YdfG
VGEAGGPIAVITGASGGIGRAVALALAERGFSPCLSGRDSARLQRVADEVAARGVRPTVAPADLGSDDGIRALASAAERLDRLDVLVHSAGALHLGDIFDAASDQLDELYRVNLRAPYLLTKALLPLLVASRGQIVFVNSSAALRARAENGLYAASKVALRCLAGSIRDRVNPMGIRVLSVFAGRTATSMQEQVHAFEGQRYDPAKLLQPGDVADIVVHALLLPRTAEITEVMVRPFTNSSSTGSVR